MKLLTTLLFFIPFVIQTQYAQLATAKKLIVTITDEWNSSTATVHLFDRTKTTWKKQREVFTASVGENGLAWGAGLHPAQKGEYMKVEGDRRSPAGIFALDTLFYGLNPLPPEGVRYPYRQISAMTRCIDDTASRFYNTIVDEGTVVKDWNSAEEMNEIDPDYTYVLPVRHNASQTKGGGSCIFFHIINVPTSGCTSMDESDMMSLLHWLDPARTTLVVQLPHAEYHRLRQQWNLPMLKND